MEESDGKQTMISNDTRAKYGKFPENFLGSKTISFLPTTILLITNTLVTTRHLR